LRKLSAVKTEFGVFSDIDWLYLTGRLLFSVRRPIEGSIASAGDANISGSDLSSIPFPQPHLTVSIVIPALNEADNLPHVLPWIPKWVNEVVLVDGHSTDDTVDIARALRPGICILHQKGHGKGAALRQGLLAATGDIVVMLDADGSTDPSELSGFVYTLLSGADFAKGSRFLQGAGTVDMPLYRKIGNWGLVTLTNLLFGTHYSDITYGYNAIWHRHLNLLALEIDGWPCEIISNIRVARHGLRVVEVASFEHNRIVGEGKLQTISAGWAILKAIVAERFRKLPTPAALAPQRVTDPCEDNFLPSMKLLMLEALNLSRHRNRLSGEAFSIASEAVKVAYSELLELETRDPEAQRLQTRYSHYDAASLWAFLERKVQPLPENVASNTIPTISVVIRTFSLERWDGFVAVMASLGYQTITPSEIIVVVDHNPELAACVRAQFPDVVVVENCRSRGSSGAWNSGVMATHYEVIAFIDDDAKAAPTWLEYLVESYADSDVIGVGGTIEAVWLNGRPKWFPEEFDWVVGCSYRGLPATKAEVRNLIGCNMSFRRQAFEIVGGFREDMGHVGHSPIGCDETEFCIRLRQHCPDMKLVHEPRAKVHHLVTPARARWGYFRRRCSLEGRSKALVSRFVGANSGLATERVYAVRTLPSGIMRGVADTFLRADLSGLGRALTISIGVTITAISYFAGVISIRVASRSATLAPIQFKN
jgi:glycosyltransferase involved in cell wall biosynthesis